MITVWQGVKRVVCGDDIDSADEIEFCGEEVGSAWEEENARGTWTKFYRAVDGRIIIHQIRWSRWEGEATYGDVYEFPSLEAAEAAFWREMEMAGISKQQ